MNGIHDMGGMHGFGPVDIADVAIFHAEWEKHACALAELVFGAGYINIDAFRAGIETMHPAAYLDASYFERWLHAVETGLIERGYLTRDELTTRLAELQGGSFEAADAAPAATPPQRTTSIAHGGVSRRFQVGDRVLVRNRQPLHHTRAPRYLRGRAGVINRCHGHEVFPDTNAHYQGDVPQVVYSVTFEGREIWGESSDPGLRVSIDLWDSYLDPA